LSIINPTLKRWAILRSSLRDVTFWFLLSLSTTAATITEDFSTDPAQRGWRTFGDPSLYHWNPTNHHLEVTWDSSRTNSFFYLPLGTILARNDNFSFSFDLRLSDIRLGNTPGKSNEFEIAVGLINYHNATNSKAFRGAGVSSTYGVHNLVEFDYFPDAGFGDTFASTMVSSNNGFAFAHNFPLTLSLGDTFHITMSYSASNQVLHTSATRNGAPFSPLMDIALADFTEFSDFRVDSFALISYSDAIQTGPPAFYGSILAHGVLDNVQLVLPPPPLGKLGLMRTNSAWACWFSTSTNWVYTLESSVDVSLWSTASPSVIGTGGTMRLTNSNAPGTRTFYRVRAERP